MRTKVLSAFKWTAIARVTSQLVTWLITLFVIRLLAPADYGLMAMCQAVAGLLLLLGSAGLGAAIIQASNIGQNEIRRVFGFLIVTNGLLFCAAFFGSPLLALYYGNPDVTRVTQVLALGFLIAPFRAIPDALLDREIDFKRKSLLDLSVAAPTSLLVLFLAWSGYGVWSLVFGVITSQLLTTIGLNCIRPFLLTPQFSLSGMKGLFTFGGYHAATAIVWYFYSQADIFIAGHYLSAEDVGYYSVGIYIASLVLSKLMPLLNQVAFPAYSRVSHEAGAIPYYLKKIVNIAALVCFPLFFGLACVASNFIEFVIPNYLNAILPLVLLCMLMPLRLLSYLLPSAVYASGKPSVEFSNTVIAAMIVIPAFVIGVQWGQVGLCIGWLVSFPIAFAIQLYRSAKVIGIGVGDYLAQTVPGLVCSSGMAVVVLTTRLMIDGLRFSVLVELVLLIGVGMCSYVTFLMLGYRRSLTEARSMFIRK